MVIDKAIFGNIVFNRTYQLFSSRWKVYIICALADGKLRFGELRRLFSQISRVTLTVYLQELEQEGYLLREEYPAPPLRTEYSLTPMAREVLPLLLQLLEWGGK